MTPNPPGKERWPSIPYPGSRHAALEKLRSAEADYKRLLIEAAQQLDDPATLTALNVARAQEAVAKEQYEQVRKALREAEGVQGARDTLRKPPVRVTPTAVRDAEGFSLRPDPLAARTPAQLVEALRLFRIWAGEPPYREIATLAGNRAAPSTICTALQGHSFHLPPLKVVLAVVIGCGGGEVDQRDFATAWRQIRLSQEDALSAPDSRSGLRALPPASETG